MGKACHYVSNGTEPMYNIPFIIWKSNKYKSSSKKLVRDIERLYNTENLIHTIADMSGITFSEFDVHKSIVNSNFKSLKK